MSPSLLDNQPRLRRTVLILLTLFATVWLAFLVLFILHLMTGFMPDNVAFSVLGIDVYWYGVIISGGIGLGAAIIAQMAEARGRRRFWTEVPEPIRELPIDELALPERLERKLRRQKMDTVGAVLLVWGRNPRLLARNEGDTAVFYTALQNIDGVSETWLTDAPWRADSADHIWNGIFWVLILGVIGARLYHVFTPPPSMAVMGIESAADYFRNPAQLVNLRNGGLGIYGGLLGGALGIWLYTRRQRLSLLRYTDLAVIGVAAGQSLGRWGNFFNQELYGRPTTLPWALHIDPVHRLPDYAEFSRFHPAFLYEGVWSLLTFGCLFFLAIWMQQRMRDGELTSLYLIFYGIGRTLLELVRLDSRTVQIGGVDVQIAIATLVSLFVAGLMAVWMVWRRRTGPLGDA